MSASVNRLGQVDEPKTEPLESVSQLIEVFHEACKPASEWRIGTEHEIIGVSTADDLGAALPYDGNRGIGAVLEALAEQGWSPVLEGATVIALAKGDEQVIVLDPVAAG